MITKDDNVDKPLTEEEFLHKANGTLFEEFQKKHYPTSKDFQDYFGELYSEDIAKILDATIKEDKINKILNFYAQASAFTEEEQLNVTNQAPSSTGKSYNPTEIAELFPKDDVIMIGYCSPTAFFHDRGLYDKETNTIYIDLERKILIFLDQPHTLLLQHLRPLLSHDKKEIHMKITDKSQKGGLKTKNIIIRGYPAVIFCSAGLKLDEQEATRFLMLSPETTKKKIKAGILEKIKRSSDKTKYFLELEKNQERFKLRQRIKAIKEAKINEIIISEDLSQDISKKFLGAIKVLKPRHQRDIGRVLSFVKISALLNFWFRDKKENENKIYVSSKDVEESFKLWNEISESQELNLPPYVFQIFKEVILPAYKGQGLSRQDIMKEYYEAYGRVLPDWLLRQQIIPMLENSGLVISEPSQLDKRKILYSPTQLTISPKQQNYSELDRGVSEEEDVKE